MSADASRNSGRWMVGGLIAAALVLGVWLVATHPDWTWALRERAERGAKLRIIDYVRAGMWWGTLFNAVLLAGLAATHRWWSRPVAERAVPSGLTRGMWLAVLAAVLAGGWFRAERLELSLYADEEYTLRSYVLGRWRAQPDGEVRFDRLSWLETFFQEHEASNHVPFSALSRVGVEWWQAAGGGEGRFDAGVFRWPSFVFGLATIPLLAWLGGLLGFPRAGVLAALLLALHPWHIRYSSEARGYGMMMAIAVLTTCFLVRGLRGGRWRDWIGFGVTQWLLLWSYPGSLYLGVTLNLAAGGALIFGARALIPRWIVGGAVGLLGAALTLGPDIPQIVEYLRLDRARGEMGLRWIQDFAGLTFVGSQWRSPDPGNPILIALTNGAGASGLAAFWLMFLVPALLFGGASALVLAGRVQAWVAAALLLCAPLGYWHASHAGNLLFLWYLIFALPGLTLVLAIGATGFSRKPRIAFGAAAGVLALFAVASHPAREVVRRHAKEPLLEVVRAAHGGRDPFELGGRSGPIVACFWSNAPVYDPWMVYVWKPIDLVIAMERSLRDGRPLYLTYGHRERAEDTVRQLLKLADNPDLFEPVRTFPGLEEAQFTHYLLRFRGDAAAVARLKERWGGEKPSPNPGYSNSSG
jgi:hypothetical protein